MEPNQPQQQNQAPDISEAELKMPEEQFGETEQVREGSGMLVPLLVVLILALAGVLGALVFWGEELMGILLGTEASIQNEVTETTATSTDEAAATTTAATTTGTTAPDFDAIEAELSNESFTTFENDMGEIETELEGDAQSTTTAE